MQVKIIQRYIKKRLLFTQQLIIVILGVLGISQLSYAELLWSPKAGEKQLPTEAAQAGSGHQGHQGQRREKAFYLKDYQNASVKYITPTLEVLSLSPKDEKNKYILPKTGMDNYHALVAERSTDTVHESSLRYPYMRGKPSGYSPEKVIKQHKLPLEIVPEPMIREHWRFYSQNMHTFKILFDKQPVTDSWVILKTSNGTTLDAKTDRNGKVTFVLPDDFKNVKPGRRANKPEEFLLRTVHIANNITYKTNFTAPYSVNPSHWKSNIGGLLTLSTGFISGIIIMRRHNNNINKKRPNKKKSRSES